VDFGKRSTGVLNRPQPGFQPQECKGDWVSPGIPYITMCPGHPIAADLITPRTAVDMGPTLACPLRCQVGASRV
jgi:hypothetical protein